MADTAREVIRKVVEVTTTDATVTTLFTHPATVNRGYSMRVTVIAWRKDVNPGVIASFWMDACFKDDGGTTGMVTGSPVKTQVPVAPGVTVTTDVSGTDLRIRVTGIAAQTWHWIAWVDMYVQD
jgi:hypothetical protein